LVWQSHQTAADPIIVTDWYPSVYFIEVITAIGRKVEKIVVE